MKNIVFAFGLCIWGLSSQAMDMPDAPIKTESVQPKLKFTVNPKTNVIDDAEGAF